jgi:hypothetical protein
VTSIFSEAVEANARADRPLASADLRYLHACRQTERVRQREHPRTHEAVARQHFDRRRGVGQTLAAARYGSHFDLGEVFQRQRAQVAQIAIFGRARVRGSRQQG